MLKTLFLVAVLFSVPAIGQTKTFRWDSEFCSYTGNYDSRKYTEAQLRDTRRLFSFSEFRLTKYPWVWKWEDIAKVDVAALDAEYKENLAKLTALNVVPLPYWQKAKEAQIKELNQSYAQLRTKALAYTDPSVLRGFRPESACTIKYAEPLAKGGDDLLKVWLEVNLDSRSRNSDPARLKREYEAELASPDRHKYAFIDVMGFGWGNCTNAEIERDDDADNGTHEKEYKKLFTRLREFDCEMP